MYFWKLCIYYFIRRLKLLLLVKDTSYKIYLLWESWYIILIHNFEGGCVVGKGSSGKWEFFHSPPSFDSCCWRKWNQQWLTWRKKREEKFRLLSLKLVAQYPISVSFLYPLFLLFSKFQCLKSTTPGLLALLYCLNNNRQHSRKE